MRLNGAGDRTKPSGIGNGLRGPPECLARALGADHPVGSTIREWDWETEMGSFAAAQILLPGRRRYKRADKDRWAGNDPPPVAGR
jgi:hypothetical protein